MALGVYGTTLLAEMNRLANGGTYRTSAQMVDMALAARQWANQRSVLTNLTDTVGVLNEIEFNLPFVHAATTAPTAGVPSANTLSIPANGVGVFAGIPPNAWFIASAASVEITPGEGIS